MQLEQFKNSETVSHECYIWNICLNKLNNKCLELSSLEISIELIWKHVITKKQCEWDKNLVKYQSCASVKVIQEKSTLLNHLVSILFIAASFTKPDTWLSSMEFFHKVRLFYELVVQLCAPHFRSITNEEWDRQRDEILSCFWTCLCPLFSFKNDPNSTEINGELQGF